MEASSAPPDPRLGAEKATATEKIGEIFNRPSASMTDADMEVDTQVHCLQWDISNNQSCKNKSVSEIKIAIKEELKNKCNISSFYVFDFSNNSKRCLHIHLEQQQEVKKVLEAGVLEGGKRCESGRCGSVFFFF